MIAKRPQLGSLLQRHGIISDGQLQTALEHQRARGGKLGEALIALGLCSELEIARVLAEQVEIPFVDLRQTPPSAQALSLVSVATARAHDARVARTESGPSPEARNFVARFRAAAAEPGATALADLSALPFLYEGRRLARDEFMREAVPALFTPAVRRCLQRAPAQSEGERLVLWCKPYGFHLGPFRGHWHLIEFVADVD